MSFSGSFTTPTKKFKQTKRLACETWWNYSPVNTTEFGVENIVKFQIPTTDAIFDMSRAFITLDYLMPVRLTEVITLASYANGSDPAYVRLGITSTTTTLNGYRFNTGDIILNQSTAYATSLNDATKADATAETGPVRIMDFGGFTNAATIFSLTEMYMDGNLLSHDDYCQTQARLWQENKNQSWIEGQKQTFFSPNAKDNNDLRGNDYSTIFNSITFNTNNILPANLNTGTGTTAKYYVKKQLKIPLVMLYPQFEVLNGWPSFLVKQILYLQLTVSDVTKYFCSFYTPNATYENLNVLDINTRNNLISENPYLKSIIDKNSSFSMHNGRNPKFAYDITGLFQSGHGPTNGKDAIFEFDLDNIQLQNVTLYLPAHTPEFKERQEYQALVNAGLAYGFKSFNVISNTFNLNVDNSTGNNTKAQSYNSSVNNLEAVNLLVMRDGTEVVYDKPSISALQCNLGNSWMQAASGTHVENLYTMDSDLYTDLLKGWGQLDKPYYNTISKSIENSFKFDTGALYGTGVVPVTGTGADTYNNQPISIWGIVNTVNSLKPTNFQNVTLNSFRGNSGSYTSYFDVSPADELGVSSGQYSKLINIRFNATNPNVTIALPNTEASRCNYPNAKIYVCQQTFSTIMITPTSVFITNPFAAEFDSQRIMTESKNLNIQANGFRNHGLTMTHGGLTTTHGFLDIVTGLIPTVVKGIKNLDNKFKQKRLNKFKKKAYKELGADGYKHYEKEINHWGQYIKPISKRKLKKWKKEWGSKNASNSSPAIPSGESSTSHGFAPKYKPEDFKRAFERVSKYKPTKERYIPGTYVKKFRVLSTPRITPGWRGGVNNRPIRLQPFGRQAAVPAMTGSMNNKHGLMPPYHGILSSLWKMAKPLVKDKIPDPIKKVVEPLKQYADPIIQKFKPIAQQKIDQFDDKVTKKADSIMNNPKVKTARKAIGWFKRAIGRKKNHGLGRKYMERANFNRFYKKPNMFKVALYKNRQMKRAGLITPNSHYAGISKFFGGVQPPHMKKITNFYRDYYSNKHGKNVLRLQKMLSRGGAQRMYEGMY